MLVTVIHELLGASGAMIVGGGHTVAQVLDVVADLTRQGPRWAIGSMVLPAVELPNPAPTDPTGSSNAVSLLISFGKYAGLVACGITAAVSGGFMAAGSLSNRPDTAEKGKRGLLWSIVGAIAAAVAIPLVNTVFGVASGGSGGGGNP